MREVKTSNNWESVGHARILQRIQVWGTETLSWRLYLKPRNCHQVSDLPWSQTEENKWFGKSPNCQWTKLFLLSRLARNQRGKLVTIWTQQNLRPYLKSWKEWYSQRIVTILLLVLVILEWLLSQPIELSIQFCKDLSKDLPLWVRLTGWYSSLKTWMRGWLWTQTYLSIWLKRMVSGMVKRQSWWKWCILCWICGIRVTIGWIDLLTHRIQLCRIEHLCAVMDAIIAGSPDIS